MVLNRIRDALAGPPKLDGPSVLPEYFPVEPKGCERHAQALFSCLATDATAKAREMERAGVHKSYFPDVAPRPGDERAAAKVKAATEAGVGAGAGASAGAEEGGAPLSAAEPKQRRLPTPDDNPLDECRQFIAYYKRCCDRELKKKKNWILTEPYRVQEEYRYAGGRAKPEMATAAAAGKS